jgi:3-hydroxyacyl-CoA dehydrogenase
VEVVGSQHTTPEAIGAAMEFYASIGKRPIHIRKEIKGHVANRLQAALWREAFHLSKMAWRALPTSTPPSRMVQACDGRC